MVSAFRSTFGTNGLIAPAMIVQFTSPLDDLTGRRCPPSFGAIRARTRERTAELTRGEFGYVSVLRRKNVKVMAHPEGFEPPTKEVEAPCSIQLSYGCPALR